MFDIHVLEERDASTSSPRSCSSRNRSRNEHYATPQCLKGARKCPVFSLKSRPLGHICSVVWRSMALRGTKEVVRCVQLTQVAFLSLYRTYMHKPSCLISPLTVIRNETTVLKLSKTARCDFGGYISFVRFDALGVLREKPSEEQ
jgi:hypothetical protein